MATPRRRTISPITKILRPFKATQVFDASEVLADAYHATEDRRSARLLMSARLKLLQEAANSSNISAPISAPKPAPKKKKPKPVEAPVVEAAPEPEVKVEPPKPKPKTNALDLNDAAMLLFAATAEEEEEAEAPTPAAEEPKKPSFDASALDVLGELGGEDEPVSEPSSDDPPENADMEESVPVKEEPPITAEKAASKTFDPTALDVLGELGGDDAQDDFEKADASEKSEIQKAGAIDMSNSFAELSALASMSDENDAEPDTEETGS